MATENRRTAFCVRFRVEIAESGDQFALRQEQLDSSLIVGCEAELHHAGKGNQEYVIVTE